MIKLENTEVLGWEAAIRGMRNPMNSWDKSDSAIQHGDDYWAITNEATRNISDDFIAKQIVKGLLYDACYIGPNDHKLMMNLAKTGSVDAKYRRMIIVTVDITAPLYWWKEFDTYKVGTVANSCSTMHKIHAKEFTLEDFSCEHLFERPKLEESPDFESEFSKEFEEWEKRNKEFDAEFFSEHPDLSITDVNPLPKSANERKMDWDEAHGAYESGVDNVNPEYYEDFVVSKFAKDLLEETIYALNYYRMKFLETKDKRFWWQMIQLLPSSYNQKRTVMLNYEVLAGIYPKRKDHKLDEWHDFCAWIKSLPYSEIITLEETNEQ
jgi:hypothetical protein